jgi:hypothetical protein
MSLFEPAEVACPACGTTMEFNLAASVNADRRPDLRLEILAGSFQRVACGACGTLVRLPPALTYMDVARGQWILTKPAADFADWTALEDIARQTFDLSYGPAASGPAQAIGKGLRPRIVFGWAALREKLLAAEEGIDDVLLELAKLAALRTVTGAPLNDESELRLVDADGDVLTLAWLVSETEQELADLQLQRSSLTAISSDEAWTPLRARLNEALFVDFGRLLLPADHGRPAR